MAITSLDETRIYYGSDRLKEVFGSMIKSNAQEAVKALNSKYLRFPTLFILQQDINTLDIASQLNTRNKYALDLVKDLLSEEDINSDRILAEYTPDNHSSIRWILETGYSEDGLSDEYDQVLDAAAIILSKVYNDRTCLKIIEELIFSRHRKGSYMYDLTWTFFEALNPRDIAVLVKRLDSSEPRDVELARKFLNFIPVQNDKRDNEEQNQYQSALKWIKQNQSFLYYTGATNQQTINPQRYAVSLEAKYLQKPANEVSDGQSRSLKREEQSCLDCFNQLDTETKLLLSEYSNRLFRSNRSRWSKWIQSPIERQIDIARGVMEGLQ